MFFPNMLPTCLLCLVADEGYFFYNEKYRVFLCYFLYWTRICKNFKNPRLAGRYNNPNWGSGPPGYIGWRNQFLGIDSWAPLTFTNSSSVYRSRPLCLCVFAPERASKDQGNKELFYFLIVLFFWFYSLFKFIHFISFLLGVVAELQGIPRQHVIEFKNNANRWLNNF